jgi:hypothetical protein
MHVRNKRPLCSALQMKQLSAITVIIQSIKPTSSLPNTNVSLFTTPFAKTSLSVISARYAPSPFHCYFSTGFSFYIEKTGCNIKVFDVYVTATLTAIEAVSASFDKRFSATIIS